MQCSSERVRLVQLVSPLKVKRSVVISAAVVTLSAIAHSAFLWLPLPTRDAAEEALPADSPQGEEMAVVVLPEADTPPPPAVESIPTQPAANPPTESVLLPADVIPPAAAPPETLPPVPTEPETPLSTGPSVNELPVANDNPTPVFTPSPNEGPLLAYGDGFPHVAGAVGGCFNLNACQRVPDVGNFRDVRRDLVAGLKNEGYTVHRDDDLTEPGREVYALTAPDSTEQQFLHIFSVTDGSAIYIMSAKPLTLEELERLSASAGDDFSLV